MFLRILLLVAWATVASAGVGGKSTVKAVAKFTVVADPDGFGYMIKLDGSESERQCANAGWFVKQGGEYVKITYRMFADYEVGEQSATYRFRLTIWDPETEERIDHDYLEVVIKGKFQKPPKGSKVKADADITKVKETENGHDIFLTAKDSLNCEETFWEYKPRKGKYIAIGEKETFPYGILKAGKHKFKLICISHSLNKKDIDTTWVKISKCKAPKFPKNKKCKKGKGKCGDPCKQTDAKAKAEVVDVPRNMKGDFTIKLTANASIDCDTYQWERIIKDQKNEKLGENMEQDYTVDKKGMYKFKVTCGNTKCQDSDSDVVETDCVSTYNPNPCNKIHPEAVAKVTAVDKEKGVYTIKLSAKGSERCQDYVWYRVSGKGEEIIKSSKEGNAKFQTSKYGKYSFKVSCIHTKCKKSDDAFIKYKIEDPCDSIEPEADAQVTKVTKEGKVYTIKLSAEGSKKCSTYKWFLLGKKDDEMVGEGETFKYKTEKPGLFKFRVRCTNSKCDKKDGEQTETKIPDPCKTIEAEAVAEVTKVKRKVDGCKISLSAAKSKKCKDFVWYRVSNKGDKIESLGEGAEKDFNAPKKGNYFFRVQCKNNKCNDKDSDVVNTECEPKVNPCNDVDSVAVASIKKVIKNDKGQNVFHLSSEGSQYCETTEWELVTSSGNTPIKGDKYKTNAFGSFTFKLICRNSKCQDYASAITSIVQQSPCKNILPEVEAKVTGYKKSGKGYNIFLSAAGSTKCNTYSWELVKSGGNQNIGAGKEVTFSAPTFGFYKFLVSCHNDECNKDDTDVTETNIGDPCTGVKCDAEATVKRVEKISGGEWKITLTAAKSKNCDIYQWYRVRSAKKMDALGTGLEQVYPVTRKGSYIFKLTCENKKCKSKDEDIAQTKCVRTYTEDDFEEI